MKTSARNPGRYPMAHRSTTANFGLTLARQELLCSVRRSLRCRAALSDDFDLFSEACGNSCLRNARAVSSSIPDRSGVERVLRHEAGFGGRPPVTRRCACRCWDAVESSCSTTSLIAQAAMLQPDPGYPARSTRSSCEAIGTRRECWRRLRSSSDWHGEASETGANIG